MCQILSSGLFSMINISLDCNTGFRVKDYDSGEYNSNVNRALSKIHKKKLVELLFFKLNLIFY